jgi:hypothetical protein
MRLRWIILAVVAVLAVGAIVVITLEPAKVFGVDGSALGSSLARELGGVGGTCEQAPERASWSCGVDLEGSGVDVDYRLTADDSGCWEAVEERPEGLPERSRSGCTESIDYVFPDKPEG